MRLMLLSENRLFTEVLLKALETARALSVQTPKPSEASKQIVETQPEIIVIDETLPIEQVDRFLRIAYSLEACKILLVNPNQNDLLTLSSQRSRIKSAGDLLSAMIKDANSA